MRRNQDLADLWRLQHHPAFDRKFVQAGRRPLVGRLTDLEKMKEIWEG